VLLVQELEGPETALDFGSELSRAFYVDGRPTDDVDSLRRVAEVTKVDGKKLLAAWSAPGAEHRTDEAFSKAREEGVVSYPTLFVERGGVRAQVVSGCVQPGEALALIQRALA